MKDWAELADEYRDLELRHKEYREVSYVTKLRPESSKYNLFNFQTLEKCMALQKKCTSGVTHQVCLVVVLDLTSPVFQKYRLGVIKKLAREIEVNPSKKEEAGEVEDLQKDLMRRSAQLDQMQEVLLKLQS